MPSLDDRVPYRFFVPPVDVTSFSFFGAKVASDNILNPFFGQDVAINIRGLGVVVFLLFTTFVGWIAKGFLGRSLILSILFQSGSVRAVSRMGAISAESQINGFNAFCLG